MYIRELFVSLLCYERDDYFVTMFAPLGGTSFVMERNPKGYTMNKVLRFFKCELTQMECAIVLVGGDEIRVPAEMVPYYLTQK